MLKKPVRLHNVIRTKVFSSTQMINLEKVFVKKLNESVDSLKYFYFLMSHGLLVTHGTL